MNEAASTRDEWLTVSEVAARLKISERTVQRRCKSGKLTARLESGDDGAAWLINGATLPTGDAITADTADNVPTGDATPNESESAQSVGSVTPDVATLPTGADTDFLAHLKAENEFLRGAIEQHQRSEAELRAALRKALEAMPKAIESREYSQAGTIAQDAQQATKTGDAGKVSDATRNTPERKPAREFARTLRRLLGIR
jgi:AraC-like DNA-binding protein